MDAQTPPAIEEIRQARQGQDQADRRLRNAVVAAMTAYAAAKTDARAQGVRVRDICPFDARAVADAAEVTPGWVYKIVKQGRIGGDGDTPSSPAPAARLPIVVYLRGAGTRERLWERIRQAVAEHGWYPVDDPTTAWHLARGGCITLKVDFTSVDGSGRSTGEIVVERVRARYDTDGTYGTDAMELVAVAGGTHPRPVADGRLDVEAVMRIAQLLLAGRGEPGRRISQ